MKCRHCEAPLRDVFIDLGSAPPSNAFLREQDLNQPELHFPLKVYTCGECRLPDNGRRTGIANQDRHKTR